MSDFWNDVRTEQLRRLWSEGKTASEIAEIIGGECTRNMVISKTRRIPGCARRESPIKKRRALPAYNTHICEWPSGTGPYTFCGKKTEPNKPYCGPHCKRAYISHKRHEANIKASHANVNLHGRKFSHLVPITSRSNAEDFAGDPQISSPTVSPHDEFTKEGTL